MSHLRREIGMLVALVLMCAGLYAANPAFLSASNVFTTTRQISMLGIFAIGISFVIIAGGIDLSVGSMVGLTGVLIAKLSSHEVGGLGYSQWVGIPVALLVAALIGLGQGLLITGLRLQPFIVTLGGMLVIRGLAQTVAKGGISLGETLPLKELANGGYFWIGSGPGSYPLLPYPLAIFLLTVIVGAFVLHFTVFGRYTYAIGGNRDAALYSGLPVRRVETSTYVISAVLAGVAGVCYASYTGQMDQKQGLSYELYAIAAAVLGGVSLRGGEGTILGVVIGSALYRVIYNGINMFQIPYRGAEGRMHLFRLNTDWTEIIVGAVILIAVILDQVVHMAQARRRTRRMAEVRESPPAAAAPPVAV